MSFSCCWYLSRTDPQVDSECLQIYADTQARFYCQMNCLQITLEKYWFQYKPKIEVILAS